MGATGLWPTCSQPSSFWLSLVPRGFTGVSARPPQGYLVDWESCHSCISETPFCGVLFPRQIGQGPHLGQPILPCPTVRAWRLPPRPDKGFGPRARSVLPVSAALGSGPYSASFRICVFQGSAVRLGGASLQVPSLPPHPSFPVEAAHLTGLAQEAPHRRMPTYKRLRPFVVTWPVASCRHCRCLLWGPWIPDKHRNVIW